MFVDWNDGFSVGISKVDAEHQFLFAIINHLFGVYTTNGTEEEMRTILSRLSAYAEIHFDHEEEHMLQNEYPGFDDHVEEHLTFRSQVQQMVDEFSDCRRVDMMNSLQFFSDWLSYHIGYADRNYCRFSRGSDSSIAC
jgi:hemerythrin-like metal-binding protein